MRDHERAHKLPRAMIVAVTAANDDAHALSTETIDVWHRKGVFRPSVLRPLLASVRDALQANRS